MAQNKKSPLSSSSLLWVGAGVSALSLISVSVVASDLKWLMGVLAAALVACLIGLIIQGKKSLQARTAEYGTFSLFIVFFTLAILGVVNYLGTQYQGKLDLTRSKLHTLSDQTEKLVKGLQKPVKAVLFAKLQQKEQVRPLLENYKALNSKFEIEYVDPDKEPARSKQLGIKRYGTLVLTLGTRDSRIEDATEEKLTNALIKLLKDKAPTLCGITGHGEKSFSATDADGLDSVKKALAAQSYEVRDFSLISDLKDGKIPAGACDAIAVLGPTKSFFPPELKALSDYLSEGGRAVIGLDISIKDGESSPELTRLLGQWYIDAPIGLIVDPLSKMLGVDASVPVVASYAKDHAITKDFRENSFFPFARPLELRAGVTPGLNVKWIGQTTPKSWAVTNLADLTSPRGVEFKPGRDKQGPLNVAVAVDGKLKDSKAARATRMVVFGTSHFASNNYSRYGGNMDFFLNSVSWVLEDESLISIRAKEDAPSKIELSQRAGDLIFLLTIILLPAAIAIGGIVIWVIRRRW
jgi:ABC-type uncharacterized transport system involved in gliding motility auxiliary subunit